MYPVPCSVPYCIVPWSLLQSSYLFLVSYVHVCIYIYTCIFVWVYDMCILYICTITTKAYTADSSALGTRCACWCALFFFSWSTYFYYQHAFKHRPLVPSAVEPPVLLHYSFYEMSTTISKVLQFLSAHIFMIIIKSSVIKMYDVMSN
jgi:hypothetical protein